MLCVHTFRACKSFLSIFSLHFFHFFFSLGLFVSNNSLLSIFSLLFFSIYPSLLDSDCLQQLFRLCFFPLTLLSWTLTISNNSSFSVFFFSFTLFSQTLIVSQQHSPIFFFIFFSCIFPFSRTHYFTQFLELKP